MSTSDIKIIVKLFNTQFKRLEKRIDAMEQKMATKEDLRKLEERMSNELRVVKERMATHEDLQRLSDQILEYTNTVTSVDDEKLSNHEDRIQNLEQKVFTT